MTQEQARDILEQLMGGVDPSTGEILPDDHLCNDPLILRALHTAILSLTTAPKERRKSNRPWTGEDLEELRQFYLSGVSITDLCARLERRERDIRKQLQCLGLILPEKEIEKKPEKPPTPGLERAGKPWTQPEDELLKSLHGEERSISEMARQLHRSPYSIFCRMERLGYYGDVPGYPQYDNLPLWSNVDNSALRQMFQEGTPIPDIAAHFGRSEKSISARLFYMGLIKELPISLFPTKS